MGKENRPGISKAAATPLPQDFTGLNLPLAAAPICARHNTDHQTACAKSNSPAPQVPDPAVLEVARAIARELARHEYSRRRAAESANSERAPKEQIGK